MSRISPATAALALGACLLAPPGRAETAPTVNAFFGFEYVLTPVAIKWWCGEPADGDLQAIDALVAANPEDAESADLRNAVDALLAASRRETGLTEILGGPLPGGKVADLCALALPLSIGGLEDAAANGDAAPDEAWRAFFAFLEGVE